MGNNALQMRALAYYASRMTAAFAGILGAHIEVSAGVDRHEIDGLLFEFVPLSDSDHLRLIPRCENCGKEMGSGVAIFTLIDLADWLMHPEKSEFCSDCRGDDEGIPF